MTVTRDEAERAITEYLTHVALLRERNVRLNQEFEYRSIEQYLLANAQFWTPPAARLPRGVTSMQPKGCFDNAFQLTRRKHFRYVEGFALSIIPVHHAWVVDEAGTVIEATWPADWPRSAYFGVVFDRATVYAARTTHNISVLQDWPNGFPVLRRRRR